VKHFLVFALLFAASPAFAQIPRITTFFPVGGKVGSTVEVEVRGANLDGADTLLSDGAGVTGTVEPGNAKVDESNKPLWQAKCGSCHELRSPSNRSMTPAQWSATVERMVKVRQAPLSADEMAKVAQYLVGAAKAGRVTAEVHIANNALPGLYELRVATSRGISTASYFEVGNLPEYIGANGKIDQAQPIELPSVANGCFMNNGEHHYFRFHAKKGARLVFNLKGFRYNDLTQTYFNPDLRIYDGSGTEVVENHGHQDIDGAYDFDPLIDWTVPADGDYVLEARDLLGRANPGSVYRLTMGPLPYDTVVYPAAVTTGATASLRVAGKDDSAMQTPYDLHAPADTGVQRVGSPAGPASVYVSSYPVVTSPATAATLPACFSGRIDKAGQPIVYPIQGSGTFEFEAYASRLGAATAVHAILLNASGGGIAELRGDGRMSAHLDAGQKYSLKVEDASGAAGDDRIFSIEARPARPGLACVARNDNVSLRPGTSATVDVILTRREAIDGDVHITADNLPPGVTASDTVIQPDRNEAWMLLTAAPDAKPSAQPFHVVATAHGPAGDVKVNAVPQELYRLVNDLRAKDHDQSVVAVRGTRQFTCELVSPKVIKVHPRKAVPVVIHIKREAGFKGNVAVFLTGLPLGWTANGENSGGGDTVTLNVRPDGNNTQPYLTRDAKFTPVVAIIEAQSDEFRFAFGTVPCAKADKISDKDDDR
jgi:hypothetical protein